LGNIPFPKEVKEVLNRIDLESTQFGKELMLEYFNDGIFSLLCSYVPKTLLTCNRRSYNNIGHLISSLFYGYKLIPGRFNPDPRKQGEIYFYDSLNWPEKKRGTSFINEKEAKFVAKKLVLEAKRHILNGGKLTDLAVIAPYGRQIQLIRRLLRKELLFDKTIHLYDETLDPEEMTEVINNILSQLVVTVDAMQGSERKIIFLTMVRNNPEYEIGFNKDYRRINVAFSRAQEKLIIVGSSKNFINCRHKIISKIFTKTVKYVKKYGVYKEMT